LLDGRSVTDPLLWRGVPRLALGCGTAAAPAGVAAR
jgi:hypothetical protein